MSSNTRAVVCAGGNGSGDAVNIMEYVTIASLGNTTDFGDTTAVNYDLAGDGCGTLGLIGGGHGGGSYFNVMESITIASTGNGSDFGDLTVGRRQLGAFSSAHGGLA